MNSGILKQFFIKDLEDAESSIDNQSNVRKNVDITNFEYMDVMDALEGTLNSVILGFAPNMQV